MYIAIKHLLKERGFFFYRGAALGRLLMFTYTDPELCLSKHTHETHWVRKKERHENSWCAGWEEEGDWQERKGDNSR